jgi:GTP-binding protein Era
MVDSNKDFNIEDYIPDKESIIGDYSNDFYSAWDSAKKQLDKNLTIAFLGTAASGKTSGIKALFGINMGDIGPIPGSTRNVKVVEISKNIYLADAPGFGDIRKEVSQKAKDICDAVDIFIYVINCEGGFKVQEKEDYQKILSFKRKVLVLFNKVDLLRPNDKEMFLEDQRKKMGVDPKDFIPVAFDPHPLIASEPINLEAVQDWLAKTLESEGKDILLAKIARDKDRFCDRLIIATSVTAAGIGALPIPGTDYAALTAIQSAMIVKIALIYGHEISREKGIALIGQVMTGQIGKQIFRAGLTALKAVGWFPGATVLEYAATVLASVVASSLTYGLGHAAKAYYRSGMEIPLIDVQNIFNKYYNVKRAGKEV